MRKWIALVLVLIFLIPCCAYAHPYQVDHDKELKYVLFGNEYKLLPTDQNQAFQHIADAVAFCIDQFSVTETAKSKSKLYNDLKGAVSLPYTFEEVELQKDEFGRNVTGKTHRKYNHRGWEFSEYPLKGLWMKRQEIVRLTVNKVFFSNNGGFLSFSWLPWNQGSSSMYKKQVEAFCALLYYVHLLGDYLEATSYSSEVQTLAPISASRDKKSPSIVGDLKDKYLPDLFPTQTGERLYKKMIGELEEIGNRADECLYAEGNIQTQEQFDAYHSCAEDLLEVLNDFIPELIRNEAFFTHVFH